jgi:hypothetical protein
VTKIGSDSRMIRGSWQISLEQLGESIKQKYGDSQEISLVYKDSTGDSITLASQDDLEYSIEDFVTNNQASKKMEIYISNKEVKSEIKQDIKVETMQEVVVGNVKFMLL